MNQVMLKKLINNVKHVDWADTLVRRNPIYYKKIERLHNLLNHVEKDTLLSWQEERLKVVLKAAGKTKYGREVGNRREFAAWPVLGKEMIRNNPSHFLVSGVLKRIGIPASTSGTTGIPLKLVRSPLSIAAEQAFIDGIIRAMGLDIRQAKVVALRGDNVKSASDQRPPFWKYSSDRKRLMMSSNHLQPKNIKFYFQAIKNFKPDCLMAYPTSLEALCGFLSGEERKLCIPYVVTSSEVLTDKTRKLAQAVLGCKVLDYYGQAERVAFAYGYGENQYYFHPFYAHVELKFAESDDLYDYYEIIGTPFWNLTMPLVRYATGDLICVAKNTSEADLALICLGLMPFRCVKGRSGDFLVARSGARLVGIDHIPREVEHVLQMQIIQESFDLVRILVVPNPLFGDLDRSKIMKNARTKIPAEMRIEIDLVDRLERTAQGKTPFVIRRGG
ncbi:MAG TPA: hypothetical protein VF260_00170 [Bacilli bacterium]